jgi:hypothetical protein
MKLCFFLESGVDFKVRRSRIQELEFIRSIRPVLETAKKISSGCISIIANYLD